MNQKQNSPKNDWWVFRGTGDVDPDPQAIERLLKVAPPSWRDFDGVVPPGEEFDDEAARRDGRSRNNPARGRNYIASDEQREMVNAALYLRRPLLITGKPGTGKSSLAYSIAYELGLGPVLRWPITSRSTLVEGLYRYDAIGRLQEAQLRKDATPEEIAKDIGKYLSLGPLGTALLPAERPRVLLIDEIDKGDIDLPNDLLNVFEEGEFEIPELARHPQETVDVRLFKSKTTFPISKGEIRCRTFPIVVMTSNGEREFPPPLLRRCLQLDIVAPQLETLTGIVKAHLGEQISATAEARIQEFIAHRKERGHLSNDQLLNAIYLLTRGLEIEAKTKEDLIERLYQPLGSAD